MLWNMVKAVAQKSYILLIFWGFMFEAILIIIVGM